MLEIKKKKTYFYFENRELKKKYFVVRYKKHALVKQRGESFEHKMR